MRFTSPARLRPDSTDHLIVSIRDLPVCLASGAETSSSRPVPPGTPKFTSLHARPSRGQAATAAWAASTAPSCQPGKAVTWSPAKWIAPSGLRSASGGPYPLGQPPF